MVAHHYKVALSLPPASIQCGYDAAIAECALVDLPVHTREFSTRLRADSSYLRHDTLLRGGNST
jgi:hypothetical protein